MGTQASPTAWVFHCEAGGGTAVALREAVGAAANLAEWEWAEWVWEYRLLYWVRSCRDCVGLCEGWRGRVR